MLCGASWGVRLSDPIITKITNIFSNLEQNNIQQLINVARSNQQQLACCIKIVPKNNEGKLSPET
jgi:hypothetical protein